ncbi:MAG: class I SAM-dependent methyltransferase [Cyanobacteriota bacterium]|nr:class I SAM-dependent methyltransferase [Cyanobacteriota bacterium]
MNDYRQNTLSERAIALNAKKNADLYQKAISQHGARSLLGAAWTSEERACFVHEGITNLPQQNWPELETVLDIGSGQGYFLSFLREKRGFRGKYIGMELLPEFDKIAKEVHSNDPQADFICADFLKYQFGDRKFDWIFSIGSLSPKKPDQEAFDLVFTEKMAQLANKGFSVFLNDLKYTAPSIIEQVPDAAYHNVEKFAENLQKRFPSSEILVIHYPHETSKDTLVHLIL